MLGLAGRREGGWGAEGPWGANLRACGDHGGTCRGGCGRDPRREGRVLLAHRRKEMAPTGGPGRSVRGWASVLRARGERARGKGKRSAGLGRRLLLGPRGRKRKKKSWARASGPRGKGEGWAGLGVWGLSFLFLFPIQTKLFEFKQNLNSTPMHSNKNKSCTSMNATKI